MPRGDRTGPIGVGPMTGRGVGICAGYETPGYMNAAFGRGAGRGRGFYGGGRGHRHQFYATGMPGWARAHTYPFPGVPSIAPEDAMYARTTQAEELAYLEEQARYLKGVLGNIETRLKDIQQHSHTTGESEKE